METLILGPGALGCAFARHLQNRVPVRLCGPRPPRSTEFTSLWQPLAPDQLKSPTLIWLTCKGTQLNELIESVLRPISIHSDSQVLRNSLLIAPQNGLGVTQILEQATLRIPICRMVVWFGARWVGRELLETLPPRRITISTEAGNQTATLARILRQTGFELDLIETQAANTTVEWKKALTSLALNPVLAIASETNGALIDSFELQTQARALQEEALLVFQRLGLTEMDRQQAWQDLMRTCRETATNRNSMLQDLESGRPLELAFLNEWICARAEEMNLDVPTHRDVVARLRRLQAKRLSTT